MGPGFLALPPDPDIPGLTCALGVEQAYPPRGTKSLSSFPADKVHRYQSSTNVRHQGLYDFPSICICDAAVVVAT
ncbi:hypothetical protein EYC84_003333 [Monilinia fructicola]|uniref:Uncharacterized protein n=1 Tax=Monilinia fructicola TaxID=38448 RepID=A0A5M9JTB0_MONFR|nr:hypothetical protein EYC84_003333 [Monilinia fructicola]